MRRDIDWVMVVIVAALVVACFGGALACGGLPMTGPG